MLVNSQEFLKIGKIGNPQETPVLTSPETPTVVSQVNAASAPTVFPVMPQTYGRSGQGVAQHSKASSTLPASNALPLRNGSPIFPLPSSPSNSLTATPPPPVQVAQPGLPSSSNQQRMSRRSALGWIIGGVAAVSIGSGAGIYFYIRHRTPEDALYVFRGHSDTVTSINWSPGGFQLVSGSRDGTARTKRTAATGVQLPRWHGASMAWLQVQQTPTLSYGIYN